MGVAEDDEVADPTLLEPLEAEAALELHQVERSRLAEAVSRVGLLLFIEAGVVPEVDAEGDLCVLGFRGFDAREVLLQVLEVVALPGPQHDDVEVLQRVGQRRFAVGVLGVLRVEVVGVDGRPDFHRAADLGQLGTHGLEFLFGHRGTAREGSVRALLPVFDEVIEVDAGEVRIGFGERDDVRQRLQAAAAAGTDRGPADLLQRLERGRPLIHRRLRLPLDLRPARVGARMVLGDEEQVWNAQPMGALHRRHT